MSCIVGVWRALQPDEPEFGLARRFLAAGAGGVLVARPVVVEDGGSAGEVGGACRVEASARLDVVRHLLPGVLAAGLAGVGRDQADGTHVPGPFLVVVATPGRLAEMVLPEMGHFMNERG
jgi:hypothetical protein